MLGRDWQAGVPGPEAMRLSVILPCFNEESNVRPLYASIRGACEGIPLELIFVDDGSSDRTCEEVNLLAARDPGVKLIRFVRNAGHQNALRAGYRAASGQFVATLDADLQHPPALLPAMLAKAQEGYDVVQMVREGAQAGLVKDLSSRAFYRIYNWLSEVPIQPQASDFRLVSRAVCDALNALPERQLIVRAILPYLGFRTASLPYRLGERLHGQASFSFSKSLHMGSDALFGFSAVPLKLAMRLGLAISILAFLYGIYNVGAKILSDRNVPGYTDVIASVLFLGGVILVYLGIIGRYILVILDHLKRRPEYVIVSDPEMPSKREKPQPTERIAFDHPAEARPEGRRAGH
jgi:glycosyltransferase involved in cell wall biosynthesis